MGSVESAIEVPNDTQVPVRVWYTLHGGCAPDGGYSKYWVDPGKHHRKSFSLSLPVKLNLEWKDPATGKTKHHVEDVKAPALAGQTHERNASWYTGSVSLPEVTNRGGEWKVLWSHGPTQAPFTRSITWKKGIKHTKLKEITETVGGKIQASFKAADGFDGFVGGGAEATYDRAVRELESTDTMTETTETYDVSVPAGSPGIVVWQFQLQGHLCGDFVIGTRFLYHTNYGHTVPPGATPA